MRSIIKIAVCASFLMGLSANQVVLSDGTQVPRSCFEAVMNLLKTLDQLAKSRAGFDASWARIALFELYENAQERSDGCRRPILAGIRDELVNARLVNSYGNVSHAICPIVRQALVVRGRTVIVQPAERVLRLAR